MTALKNADGVPAGIFMATIRARPWIKWLIVDSASTTPGRCPLLAGQLGDLHDATRTYSS